MRSGPTSSVVVRDTSGHGAVTLEDGDSTLADDTRRLLLAPLSPAGSS